ncbi:MAG: dienelactone hydrolase family protein [Gloeocapsa sp. DLM2.Bin57]|nr:MAG: dienelactone hydrolase family protein [Gloeocapsa sp. DLM2.Bin57]
MVEINTKTVQIKNGDLRIDAYLAIPQTAEKLPAVIVIQEIFGVNNHIQDVTRRIAQAGYVAIAPAIYQRLAPGLALGYTPEDITIGKEYKNQTQATELISDIQATIDYLYSLPQVKTTGVGTIGFCFGGHVTYLTATIEAIKATASFYGAGITTWTPGEGEPTLSKTKDIKGTIYTFFGLEDASIPVAEVDQIQQELEKYQIPHQVYRYPNADHGFFCDQRASYNQQAAEDAWQQVLKLYAQVL